MNYSDLAYDVWLHLLSCGPKKRAALVKCFRVSDDDMRYALNLLDEQRMVKVSRAGVWSAVFDRK